MIADAKSAALYPEWLSRIKSPGARDAFMFLVGAASTLTTYQCHPQRKGVVRDFRFIDATNEQPFALIPNQAWLLFYFRQPAVRSGKLTFEQVRAEFASARDTGRGEWTVRLASIEDVKRLWQLLDLR